MTNVKQVVALTVFLLSAVAYSADFNVRGMESPTPGALLSRRVCEEGFVLLKNENAALPLAKGAKVAVFAPAYGQWLAGSGVSALVKSPYVVDLPEGLANAGFDVDPDSRETAVFVISRECGRGKEPDLGAYELKDEETAERLKIPSSKSATAGSIRAKSAPAQSGSFRSSSGMPPDATWASATSRVTKVKW